MKFKGVFSSIYVFSILAGCVCGYTLGFISGPLNSIAGQLHLTKFQISHIAGAILLGCVISSIFTGFLNDLIGRKLTMQVTLFCFLAGFIQFILSSSYDTIYVARLTQGIAFGMCVIAVPVYLSEISPKNKRGRIIIFFQLSLTGGVLLSNILNLLIPFVHDWRLIMIFIIIVNAAVFLYSVPLPESPRLLLSVNENARASASLEKLRSLYRLEISDEEFSQQVSQPKIGVLQAVLHKEYIYPIFIVTAAVSLNQLSGINAFLQCSVTILKQSGINSEIVGLIGGFSLTTINFVATVLTLIFVERIGRRKILMIGTSALLVTLLMLSACSHYLPDNLLKGYITLAGILMLVGFFAFGPGGVILALCTELLPNKVRGAGISISFTIGALTGVFFVSGFMRLSETIGYGGLYLLIAVFVFCYLIISYIIPETKGKTLEEIEKAYKNKSSEGNAS